jgi:Membrane bound O-acyl transferase family
MIPFPFGLALFPVALAASWAFVAVGAWRVAIARRGARVGLAALVCAAPLATTGPGPVQLAFGLFAGYLVIRAAAVAASGRGAARSTLGALLGVEDLLRSARPAPWRTGARAFALGAACAAACVALLVAGDRLRLWRWSRYADDLLVGLEVAVGATGLHHLVLAAAGRPVVGLQDRPALSASLGQFWAARWNHLVAPNLDRGFFRPLARRRHAAAGVVAAFAASGVMHVLPVLAAAPLTVSLGPAVAVMGFFLLHATLVLAERALGWHRAPMSARALRFARARTVVLFALLSPMMLGPFADVCHVHGRALGP